MMKTPLSVLLLGLVAASVMSCKSPKAPETQAVAKPAPAEKPADPLFDTRSFQSSYWQRAMSLYKPPAQGDFATIPEESEAPSAADAAPAPAAAPAPIPVVPPATKAPAIVPSELPFGTRLPGQMARCPYSGKVFRVPPK